MAEVCDLMRMVGWHYVRYITSISLPSNSFVLQFPTCRKPWFSLRNFVMSSPPLGSPVTYWMTGWLECVQRPYSLPFWGQFSSLGFRLVVWFVSVHRYGLSLSRSSLPQKEELRWSIRNEELALLQKPIILQFFISFPALWCKQHFPELTVHVISSVLPVFPGTVCISNLFVGWI